MEKTLATSIPPARPTPSLKQPPSPPPLRTDSPAPPATAHSLSSGPSVPGGQEERTAGSGPLGDALITALAPLTSAAAYLPSHSLGPETAPGSLANLRWQKAPADLRRQAPPAQDQNWQAGSPRQADWHDW